MQSLLEFIRRPLSWMLTMLVLTASVTAAAPLGADARSEHCKAPCRHCQTSSAMTCCGTDRSEPSSLPLQTSTTGAQAHHAAAFMTAAYMTVAAVHDVIAPSAVRFAPPHGYRTTDLPILNAAFLI